MMISYPGGPVFHLGHRHFGRHAAFRHVLMIALRHRDGVLANCALHQLDGLAGAW
ncbi:hypothetical protein [Pandoraea communis]|nr:hypothetical protein [Pandoraea communis]